MNTARFASACEPKAWQEFVKGDDKADAFHALGHHFGILAEAAHCTSQGQSEEKREGFHGAKIGGDTLSNHIQAPWWPFTWAQAKSRICNAVEVER